MKTKNSLEKNKELLTLDDHSLENSQKALSNGIIY
jgi:hypothetical protein